MSARALTIDAVNAPKYLHAAFSATCYRAWLGERAFDCFIDHTPPPAVLDWIRRVSGQPSGWIITADNPVGRPAHDAHNRSQRTRLDAALAAHQLATRVTEHIDPAGRWPVEIGRLIASDDRRTIHALARRFEQAAYVRVAPDTCALCWL